MDQRRFRRIRRKTAAPGCQYHTLEKNEKMTRMKGIEKITALCERLLQDDRQQGESNSITNQKQPLGRGLFASQVGAKAIFFDGIRRFPLRFIL